MPPRTAPQAPHPPEHAGRARVYFLLAAAVVVIMAGWIWQQRGSGRPSFERRPDQNVLIVTIDTLRADALRSYGGIADTANLDRLASEGVRFTFAHAHAVVTLPSHSSILTGRYPFEHGVRDNAGFRLSDSAVTLAETLRDRGWATGAFVGAFPVDRQFGLAQGFDVYDDLGGRQVAQAEFAFAERKAEVVVAAARAWIEQQQKPWFAWVHVFDPHAPYAPPAPFDSRYPGEPYAGEVAYVDQALGPLLELARGGSRPTTIIVTADHGEGLGDHGEPTHGVFAYESTLKVPLILAQVTSGTRPLSRPAVSDVPVRHVDIVPTIADLLGIDAAANLPGRSLLAAIDSKGEAPPSYFEAMTPMLKRGWAPLRGVLEGRNKYIELPLDEVYDLAADPREEKNIARTDSARARTLAERLAAFNAALPGDSTKESPAVRARLQSLGYLSGSAPRKAKYTEEDDPKQLIDVDRLMIQGIEFHRAGRAAQAQDAYRQVIARRPDMGLAYRRLAFIQWEAGAPKDAIATLRQALDRNGPDVDIEVRLGNYLAETGALPEATATLERVVKADPENIDALNALGIAHARAGRNAEAIRLFEQILKLDSRNVYALENLGTVYLQTNNLSAARDAFSRAISNDPGSSRAHAGLGAVAIQTGQREAAIEHWRRAVDLDRTNYDALFNLGTELLNAGRNAEARIYLERFVQTAPRAFYWREIEKIQRALR
jgi:arylsulfatase A-like enzyme/Tfp pilus assembly protein PilF